MVGPAGEPVAKSAKKKLEKAYGQQAKLHEKVRPPEYVC